MQTAGHTGQAGDSKEKLPVRRGAGSFQKRQESKAGEGCEFTYGGTRGGYETVSMKVSHIKRSQATEEVGLELPTLCPRHSAVKLSQKRRQQVKLFKKTPLDHGKISIWISECCRLAAQLTLESLNRRESASKQFAEEVLKAHNDYRKKHGVPPLKLCKKLNRGAQQYAEELATTRVLKHSSESANGKCGENLAWASYDQPGKDVADRWYSEIKNYSFQNPGFSSGTGHFTAMVWKNTKKMGVGKASASDGSTFVVARYDPAGNVVNPGYYEENVLPPRK
ncbi:PREDICTED: golgi-associated plant pathogenesis-related protein 1 [Buceros rhinoceros silvestris]|nr:PREDICTED: golgi-associated plant pathogenesis-related protein 1 [Buceros rhinoceros silvestris]